MKAWFKVTRILSHVQFRCFLPTEGQAAAAAGCLLPSQQGPMISAGYHWVSLRSKPLRWQWLGGYWGRSPEGAACLWKLMIESIHDTHKQIHVYCVHTGTDGRGGSDDFVAAVADD